MGLLTKKQIRELIKERNMKTTNDISLMLKDMFAETLQEMIEAEPLNWGTSTDRRYLHHDGAKTT